MIGRQRLADHIRSAGLLSFIRKKQELLHGHSQNSFRVEASLKCVQAMNNYTNDHHFVEATHSKGEDPLNELYYAAQRVPSLKDGICSSCQDFVTARIKRLRQSLWDSLEKYFSGA